MPRFTIYLFQSTISGDLVLATLLPAVQPAAGSLEFLIIKFRPA